MAAAPRILFVTSALPYASGDIHFGHLLEHIQTDIWVRFQRLQGHRVIYACADDSHGTPMMLTAERLGEAPEALVERYRRAHAEDLAAFHVDHDIYYTTHSEENRQCAELIFERCREAGLIFTREVSQYFDPEKGMFLADRFLKGTCPRCDAEDQYGDNCEKCGATYEATELKAPRSTLSNATPELRSSEHYFFDLAKQQAFLEKWTQSGTLQPEVANKIQEWLAAGLKPWDISRDAPYFGFKIPGSDNKYFYVWLDAPIGYMAALKKLEAEGRSEGITFEAIWGADSTAEVHHFIGKDIVNFHTLFWPAMLDAQLPYADANPHPRVLNRRRTKMSKSRGTFINASTYRAHLDPEYLRYYFAAKLGPNTDDIDLSLDDFVARVNADLVGKVVNIASRCAGFLHKQHGGQLGARIADKALWAEAQAALGPIASAYDAGEYGKAIRAIMALADRANQYIDAQKPWVLAKDPEQGEAVQAICTLGLNLFRILVITLKPVLPKMAAAAETFLGGAELCWADANQWLGGQGIEPFKPLKTRLERSAVDAMVEASKDSAPPAPAPAAAPQGPATIDIAQFQALDLRAAQVLSAETVEGADKLLRLTLDVGPLGQRTVLSGIRSAYAPEDLLGRFVVLLANLAPRKMRFGVSEGMVLAAGPGGKELFLLGPDSGVTPGMEIA